MENAGSGDFQGYETQGCPADPLRQPSAATSPNALGEDGWGFWGQSIHHTFSLYIHELPHSQNAMTGGRIFSSDV
jgi:hypothetical protein